VIADQPTSQRERCPSGHLLEKRGDHPRRGCDWDWPPDLHDRQRPSVFVAVAIDDVAQSRCSKSRRPREHATAARAGVAQGFGGRNLALPPDDKDSSSLAADALTQHSAGRQDLRASRAVVQGPEGRLLPQEGVVSPHRCCSSPSDSDPQLRSHLRFDRIACSNLANNAAGETTSRGGAATGLDARSPLDATMSTSVQTPTEWASARSLLPFEGVAQRESLCEHLTTSARHSDRTGRIE
jgi:hypothetical protein